MVDYKKLHDCKIHGISFVSEPFLSALILDIDYIVSGPAELRTREGTEYVFDLARAQLKFDDVADFLMQIDHRVSGSFPCGLDLFIVEIVCTPASTPDAAPESMRWEVVTNNEKAQIAFLASKLTVTISSPSRQVIGRNFLLAEERMPVAR